ncbi:hypothetical protein A0J48_007135 [Sphaerospermopsis aphanizomenoides BCCUSP55]|uniref:hypothetical protein n=1 Tax=Sphaerospermopsis aphanizomenoides TaxID=459663 RepID=UPI00190556D6|nr:hypothetical protein [Sphaerospermopsis aphanizomenoides]MBK1987310.1 hypothetical protein [Sphaerospermopsis aphanizomenoides BCCUSP55]
MSFRELERYESQKAAYDNYKAWKALSPDAKQALYDAIPNIATSRAKPVLVGGFVIPFNATGTIVTYIETTKILSATQGTAVGSDVASALRTALSGQYFATATGTTPVILTNPRYKFAKLSFTNRESFVDRVSRITKRKYKKPSSDTVSMPFGGKTMTDDYDTAVNDIKTKANGANAWKNSSTATVKKSYKFTPEG